MLPPFGPTKVLVFSRSAARSAAWHNFFGLYCEVRVPHSLIGEPRAVIAAEDILQSLDRVRRGDLLNLAVVVDLTDASTDEINDLGLLTADASPLERFKDGMRLPEIVLQYPEVYWIFVMRAMPAGYPEKTLRRHFVSLEAFPNLLEHLLRHGAGYRAWFDPSLFRHFLLNSPDKKTPAEQFGAEQFGIAMDDEAGYCIFNGYVLYRNGFQTFVVGSLKEMKDVLLGDEVVGTPSVIEDVELQFDDTPTENAQSEEREFLVSSKNGDVLQKRLAAFPILKKAEDERRRIIVSADPPRKTRDAITKPYCGMLEPRLARLWKAGTKPPKLHAFLDKLVRLWKSPLAPPRAGDRQVFFHGATYRKQHVAERLLIRARDLERSSASVESAIHTALLASEARRILNNMTFTLSLEAIAIQYRSEVTAECAFPGGAPSLSPKLRFRDLERDLASTNANSTQVANSLVAVANDLHAIYRAKGQHVAADVALNKLRDYRLCLRHKSVQGRARIFKKIVRMPWMLADLYFNILMRSFAIIVFFCAFWIVVFSFAFSEFIVCDNDSVCATFTETEWIYHSASTFLALQPGVAGQPSVMQPKSEIVAPMRTAIPSDSTSAPIIPATPMVLPDRETYNDFWLITILEMVCGFIHMGVLISYLFQRLTR